MIRLGALNTGETIRVAALGVAVVLEGAALLSLLLQSQFFRLGTIYPNFVSVAVFVLPSVVGFLARRLEAAIVLALLPFWITAVVYLAQTGAPWFVDLLQLGVLTERVAATTILLGVLGAFGWLVGRIMTGRAVASLRSPATQ
jgi:hypothetical protein